MKSYTQTDRTLHQLCQTIAKANRTFVPKQDDDSHTNLFFDSVGNRITGRWIQAENQKVIFSLNLENLNFEILDASQQILKAFPVIGLHISEIEKDINNYLPQIGLSKNGFLEELHFEIPKYDIATQAIAAISDDNITEWKNYRSLVNKACLGLLGLAQVWEEIRIWPHHFDTGIFIKPKSDLGLGFGLAMEDEMVGAPYFYLAAYPDNMTIDYSTSPRGNNWEWELGEHWKGAAFPIDKLQNKSETQQELMLNEYISTVFRWLIEQ